MRYCRKIKLFLLSCLLILSSLLAWADGNNLNIKGVELVALDDSYMLNADVEVRFSDEIEQAISKGFELSFLIEFQLVSPRKYWFDDEIATVSRRVALSYHALSRQYLVMRGEQQKTFSSLAEAIQELSKIRDIRVFSKSALEKGEQYNATLLMRLDRKKLPKALQVEAIGSDNWELISQRFEWSPNLSK